MLISAKVGWHVGLRYIQYLFRTKAFGVGTNWWVTPRTFGTQLLYLALPLFWTEVRPFARFKVGMMNADEHKSLSRLVQGMGKRASEQGLARLAPSPDPELSSRRAGQGGRQGICVYSTLLQNLVREGTC